MELIAPYKLNLSGLNAFLKATNFDLKYIYHSTLTQDLIHFIQSVIALNSTIFNILFSTFLPDC